MFFKLEFTKDEEELFFSRVPNGKCKEELFFIAGNEDGSLTMVTGQEFSWDLNHPFKDKLTAGHKGQLLYADKSGLLGSDIVDTVVAPVPVRR